MTVELPAQIFIGDTTAIPPRFTDRRFSHVKESSDSMSAGSGKDSPIVNSSSRGAMTMPATNPHLRGRLEAHPRTGGRLVREVQGHFQHPGIFASRWAKVRLEQEARRAACRRWPVHRGQSGPAPARFPCLRSPAPRPRHPAGRNGLRENSQAFWCAGRPPWRRRRSTGRESIGARGSGLCRAAADAGRT